MREEEEELAEEDGFPPDDEWHDSVSNSSPAGPPPEEPDEFGGMTDPELSYKILHYYRTEPLELVLPYETIQDLPLRDRYRMVMQARKDGNMHSQLRQLILAGVLYAEWWLQKKGFMVEGLTRCVAVDPQLASGINRTCEDPKRKKFFDKFDSGPGQIGSSLLQNFWGLHMRNSEKAAAAAPPLAPPPVSSPPTAPAPSPVASTPPIVVTPEPIPPPLPPGPPASIGPGGEVSRPGF